MTKPDRHEVANALLAAYCQAGRCERDIDDIVSHIRRDIYVQADNLLANPGPLLEALGVEHE